MSTLQLLDDAQIETISGGVQLFGRAFVSQRNVGFAGANAVSGPASGAIGIGGGTSGNANALAGNQQSNTVNVVNIGLL